MPGSPPRRKSRPSTWSLSIWTSSACFRHETLPCSRRRNGSASEQRALRRPHAEAVALLELRLAAHAHPEVAQQAVREPVDPAVAGQLPAALPGAPDGSRAADVHHLLAHVELAQEGRLLFLVGERAEAVRVLVRHILDVAQPVVGQTDALLGERRAHAAAAVVADD